MTHEYEKKLVESKTFAKNMSSENIEIIENLKNAERAIDNFKQEIDILKDNLEEFQNKNLEHINANVKLNEEIKTEKQRT